MRTLEAILQYARSQAAQLESDMVYEREEYGYAWHASPPTAITRIAARGAAALEFLRQYAGADSYWMERALAVYKNKEQFETTEAAVRALADMLREWADQAEAGITEVAGSRAWAEFGIASTDLMQQVRRLLEDRQAHPAAAIVLCGAALEIALRAIIDARGLECDERPTLSVLTRVLRREDIITVQDVKDIEQCAGLRNLAAHGDFETLSLERAGLMEQQTNLLLRRLSEIV